jgi:hypothetical protein
MAYVIRTRPGDTVSIDGPAVIRHVFRRRSRRRNEHVWVIVKSKTVHVRLDKGGRRH